MTRSMAVALVFGLLLPASVGGQTNETAPTQWDPPTTSDGQPDIQGLWRRVGGNSTTYSFQAGDADRRVHLRITGQITKAKGIIVDPPDGKIPYQPWAAAIRQALYDQHTNLRLIANIDPVSRGCFLSGVPRANYQGGISLQILQQPGQVVMLYEFQHGYRVIRVDGRAHVAQNIKFWMGDSRGRWEGNTLVVETTNHNDQTWFDIVGGFHTDALRVVERWTFVDADTLAYEATREDPQAFTRLWKIAISPFKRSTDDTYEQFENACVEGNRFLEMQEQSSSVRNTNPLAVLGYWRVMTIPATHCVSIRVQDGQVHPAPWTSSN